jgi:hypothetical protein
MEFVIACLSRSACDRDTESIRVTLVSPPEVRWRYVSRLVLTSFFTNILSAYSQVSVILEVRIICS